MMTKDEALAFRQKIEQAASLIDDENALALVELFPLWVINKAVIAGDRVQDEGVLYKCIQAHTTQAGWKPKNTPALWTKISVEEWPEWAQPLGAHDAYMKDSKVSFNSKHWMSIVDNNVWQPGVYGWVEVM